jgi:NADH-ubiquinone oxidoreductase chain 6
MNSFNLFLDFLTLISLISALCVITSTNPVIAIVFLIVLFINVGIYLILMGLQFIGLSYLLVYVGAITVLFLFIVMMLSSNSETDSFVDVGVNFKKLLPLMFLITVLFLILFSQIIPSFFVDFTNEKFVLTVYSTINTFILSIKDELFKIINNPSFLSSLLFEPNFLFYNDY